MRQQLADVPGEEREHPVLVRRQLHRLAARPNATRFSRSIRRSPISTTGSVGWVGAPQRRAQAREELVDPERLRHVVVGAGVERRHLLASRRRPRRGRSPGRRSSAAAPGRRRCRSRPAAAGRGSPRRAVASPPRRAPARRSRPWSTSYPAPRRFVRSARRICGSSSTTRILAPVIARPDSRRRVGSVSTSIAPFSAASARRLPPFSSAKPRAIARPSPVEPPALAAPERLEHGLEVGGGDPRTVVGDADHDASRRPAPPSRERARAVRHDDARSPAG